LREALQLEGTHPAPANHVEVNLPVIFRRRSGEIRILVKPDSDAPISAPCPSLIKAISRAQVWFARLTSGESIKQVATAEGLTTSFVSRTIRLAFLAPDIVDSIFAGHQPEGLNTTHLLRDSHLLPMARADQRKLLGF
ncbi:MAG: hypothetical protein JWM91_2372, partial [Rhodospirillales bacterium]|nr:hypothetical protein [Rhodospirillales bacterium]